MTNAAVLRLRREITDIICSKEIPQCSIKIEIVNDNWRELRGEIAGPPGTPYEGGKFKLEVIMPERYPLEPPKIRFVTKIWHPNISSVTGAICINTLKEGWMAIMTMHTVLLSLQALLAAAEPDNPQDAVVAAQYKNKFELFKTTARHWTSVYAGGPNKCSECEEKIKILQNLGINEHVALTMLSNENWDLAKASGRLFN
uniref:UBC core domain-containing protein n=1 Tax=Glossina brevipalpis TaxID=37001 RepID=A0A1A9WK58_9MUSC